jgi:DNA replication and repair protein RecF
MAISAARASTLVLADSDQGNAPFASGDRLWVERLRLTEFRNYPRLAVELGPEPVVLTGANGSGKTNLMEALSLLSPGQGIRRVPYAEMARAGSDGIWAVSAIVHTPQGPITVGTGANPHSSASETGGGRLIRIDQRPASAAELAERIDMVWVTPAMDGLFTGPASERRRFLDRLVLAFDPDHRTRLNHFERAARQRNRLLETERAPAAQFEGLELQIAETGTAIAAARIEAVSRMRERIEARRLQRGDWPFPWAAIALEGRLEQMLATMPAVEVEDSYRELLAAGRGRDRAAGRMLEGPHRSDLLVEHGPKAMPARLSSTGEQKALLVGLVLAHAELVSRFKGGHAPILLLDEIAAHLDAERRQSLFEEILALGCQCFMTGTDPGPFSALKGRAQFLAVANGTVSL